MLHRIELPPEADRLRWVVRLQERLLRGLCDAATRPTTVSVAWVQQLWRDVPPEWVERFCHRCVNGRTALALMQSVAAATVTEKARILAGFLNDCQLAEAFVPGDRTFRLHGVSACGGRAPLADAIKRLFLHFYDPHFDPGEGVPCKEPDGPIDNLDRLLGITLLWAERLGYRMRAKIAELRARRRSTARSLSNVELRDLCSDWAAQAAEGKRHVEFALLQGAFCRAAAEGDTQFLEEFAAVNAERI